MEVCTFLLSHPYICMRNLCRIAKAKVEPSSKKNKPQVIKFPVLNFFPAVQYIYLVPRSPIIVVLVVALAGEDVSKIHGNDGPLEIIPRASVETHDGSVLAWLRDHTIDRDISLGRDGIHIIKL